MARKHIFELDKDEENLVSHKRDEDENGRKTEICGCIQMSDDSYLPLFFLVFRSVRWRFG